MSNCFFHRERLLSRLKKLFILQPNPFMKNLKSVLFSVLLVCFAFFAVTYTACKKESKRPSCAQLNCINGGACNNGVCVCPTGYTGTYCEQEIVLPDPCKDVVCQNGGTCVDGSCFCPAGYEGEHCEIKSSLKYVGTYTAVEAGYPPYPVVINADPANPTKVYVQNLGNYGCTVGGSITWNGTVATTTLMINDEQCSMHMAVELNYALAGGVATLTGTYTVVYSGHTNVTSVVLTKY